MPFTDDQIRDAVIKLFKKYDKDQTGYIEGAEIEAVLRDLTNELVNKKQMTLPEIQKVLSTFDFNQDGRVTLDEMYVLMRKLNP